MDDTTWARLTRVLGMDCLHYLLACEDSDWESQSTPKHLTAPQKQAFAQLEVLFPYDIPDGASKNDSFTLRCQTSMILGLLPQRYSTTAADIRRMALGHTQDPVAQSTDPVLSALLELLYETYALLLLPDPAPGTLSAAGRVYGHPADTAAQSASLSDPVLAQLFTEDEEHQGRVGYYVGPNSHGAVQLEMFSTMLVTKAWDFARLEAVTPSRQAVEDKLGWVVSALRDVIGGKSVELPARIGFTGVQLPSDFAGAEVQGYRIRRADLRDRWIAKRSGIDGQAGNGDGILIDYAGNVVLETTTTYNVKIKRLKHGKIPPGSQEFHETLNETLEVARLALALAPSSEKALVAPSWTQTFDLLAQGWNTTTYAPRTHFKLQPRQLDPGQATDWVKWIDLLKGNPDRSQIHIAMRRFLLALGEWRTLEDMLIDSVVVWENLFGAAGDTTLRVCGSMAWILEEDTARRKQLREDLTTIYNFRSRIVHGSKVLEPAHLQKAHDALDIAARALRVVFNHRQDLLKEKDGEARSLRVLLGD
jgi:hypothetical protein